MAATGRQGRAERLNERLRGAQRANVEADETFNLDIAGLEEPAPPTPARRTLDSPAKRKRTDDVAPNASQSRVTTSRRSVVQSQEPVELPDSTKKALAQRTVETTRQEVRKSIPDRTTVARSSVSRRSATAPIADDGGPDALESLPEPSSARSPARSRISKSVLEEIAESPVAAPGSGRRRAILSSAAGSTARLQEAIDAEEDDFTLSSSPLVAKKRRSGAAASVRSARSTRQSVGRETVAEVDELSPDRSREDEPGEEPSLPLIEEVEEEEAEEIDGEEAAQTLGRKRPRRSLRSPELGSGAFEDDDVEQPIPKRRRGQPSESPAVQRQPPRPKARGPKPRKTQASEKKTKDKAAPKAKSATRQSDNADETPIEVTVQRFVNYQRPDDDEDPLHADLPFAIHNIETVVDVFAQVCEEVMNHALMQLQQRVNEAGDAAAKKAVRIKMRAIEAYREELSSRLLQHAIHLNHWQSLRKRVRSVQKEKLTLRDEILQLKAEREQVALRMDAVRIKHEADTKESTYRLDTSALMHDIDLAVEQGKDAPKLSRAAEKQAELANLELAVSRISEQASSTSWTGGFLSQVKDFNAFLERAAVALETR